MKEGGRRKKKLLFTLKKKTVVYANSKCQWRKAGD
jgi:hypothetical protein